MCLCASSWHAIIVDGHSVEELCKALSHARHQPTAIIAKTIKGKGIPGNSLVTNHFTNESLLLSCVQCATVYAVSLPPK